MRVKVVALVPVPVIVKLQLFVAEPPVVPNVIVLIAELSVENPPVVKVLVKLVTVAILSMVPDPVNMMLLLPNVIERTLDPVELKTLVVKSNPFNAKIPLVSVVVPVAVKLLASVNVLVTA